MIAVVSKSATRATAGAAAAVSAPGKVFLAGEYAVLQGGTAVVAAVSRRASARFAPGQPPASPLVAEAARATRAWLAERALSLPAGSPDVDTAGFSSEGGGKLGLGSSAAAAVAAVGALLDAAGIDVATERPAVLGLADDAHRAFQGGVGSGADIAAAVHGGLLAVTRRRGQLDVEPLPALPVELVVFATGRSSSTVEQVAAVAALRERAPDRHAAALRALGEAARVLAEAIERADGPGAVQAARGAHAAMEELGRAADVPIVTPALAAAAELAAGLGGAAKPSGAGGGDVGVAMFTGSAAAEAFRARAPGLGLSIVAVGIDPEGLSRHETGAEDNRDQSHHVERKA
jgi:mevalonate kinase